MSTEQLTRVPFTKKVNIITSNFFLPKIDCYFAENKKEIKAAQRLRYKVFFSERDRKIISLKYFKKDSDRYDQYADHLIVTHRNGKFSKSKIIGTYRLLNSKSAKYCGFYSKEEFDIDKMLKLHSNENLLELSRSCIHKNFRKKNVLQYMWKKIHHYILDHNIDVLFGMASFLNEKPEEIKTELTYLYKKFLMDETIKVKALDKYKVNMNIADLNNVSELSIVKKLPTLVKAYLKLGAKIGDGAVIDNIVKTTDIFVYLPYKNISKTYLKKFI